MMLSSMRCKGYTLTTAQASSLLADVAALPVMGLLRHFQPRLAAFVQFV